MEQEFYIDKFVESTRSADQVSRITFHGFVAELKKQKATQLEGLHFLASNDLFGTCGVNWTYYEDYGDNVTKIDPEWASKTTAANELECAADLWLAAHYAWIDATPDQRKRWMWVSKFLLTRQVQPNPPIEEAKTTLDSISRQFDFESGDLLLAALDDYQKDDSCSIMVSRRVASDTVMCAWSCYLVIKQRVPLDFNAIDEPLHDRWYADEEEEEND